MADALHLERHTSAAAMLHVAAGYLRRHEVELTLPLGILEDIAAHPEAWDAPYLATIHRGDAVAGIAVQTPPHNVIVALDDASPISMLVADLARTNPAVPGVVGRPELAAAFAEAWCEPRSLVPRVMLEETLYELRSVEPPARPAAGAWRQAELRDRVLLIGWMEAFEAEAVPHASNATASVDRSLAGEYRRLWLWEDEAVPVSMCGAVLRTGRGSRIGPVYTPPELRGRGYAGSLVAAVSQRLLDEGRAFCCLFADRANATANHVYRSIGFAPIGEMVEVHFRPG